MISLVVDGSPDDCREAARGLRALRTRLTTLADEVAVVRAGSSGAWTGLAGERFRTRTGSAVTSADEQAESVATVAAALDTLADRLEGVRAAMAAARAIALAAGIPVSPRRPAERGRAAARPARGPCAGARRDRSRPRAGGRGPAVSGRRRWPGSPGSGSRRRTLGCSRPPAPRGGLGPFERHPPARRPARGTAPRVPRRTACPGCRRCPSSRCPGGSRPGVLITAGPTSGRRRSGSRWTTTPTSTGSR